MSQIFRANCPLCEKEAEYFFRDAQKRKVFNCQTCISFVITDLAEKRLDNSIKAWRIEYSKKASQLSGDKLLHIYVPPLNSQEALVDEVEIKEKWCRPF